MSTLPETNNENKPVDALNGRRLQVILPEEVFRRIKVKSALSDRGAADIISELVMEHLPPVPSNVPPEDQTNEITHR